VIPVFNRPEGFFILRRRNSGYVRHRNLAVPIFSFAMLAMSIADIHNGDDSYLPYLIGPNDVRSPSLLIWHDTMLR
jgi:hypothetical protein